MKVNFFNSKNLKISFLSTKLSYICKIFVICSQISFSQALCPQPDIIINSNTDWTGITVGMCPNQKIIVNNGATLTITQSTIQLESTMSGQWDGIVLNGTTARLVVTNESTIRQAKVAISTTNSLYIRVINSIITECDIAIKAIRGSNPGQFFPHIYITQSNISNTFWSEETSLIKLSGYNLVASRSILTNNSTSTGVGISTINSKVWMRSVKIATFYRGVSMLAGGGLNGTSLTMYNCDVLRSNTCIYSRAMNLIIDRCYLPGKIDHRNSATGEWTRNNFLGSPVKIDNPNLSHKFVDNRFSSSTLLFAGDQSLTDATCNFWDSNVNSVDGTAGKIKSDWGMYIDGAKNRHIEFQFPLMNVIANNDIHNWSCNWSIFTFDYKNSFKDKECDNHLFYCEEGWRTDTILNPITDYFSPPIYDNYLNDMNWQSYNNTYLEVLDELNGADPSTNPNLRTQLENALVGMGNCVNKFYSSDYENLTTSEINTWISRAAPIVTRRGVILDKFNGEEFNSLLSYLNGLNLVGEENIDKNNLVLGVEWMIDAIENQLDIYNLSSSNLNELITITNLSSGDYTEVLRGWLSFFYNIYPSPPVYLQKSKSKLEDQSKVAPNIIIEVTEQNCLMIISRGQPECYAEIFDLQGRTLFQSNVQLTGRDCINTGLYPGVYKVKISGKGVISPELYTYFVK